LYAHCFVCHRHFGTNDVLKNCPLGRRLAFEPRAGRLWIVCTHCSQWCLVPVESRWEAIEECESLFRSAAVRVSSENVGLAEITRSLTLIRVGDALRNELANWRYGARIRRRRRRITRAYAIGIGGMATVFAAAALVAGHPTVAAWLGLVFIPYAIALRNVPNWQRLAILRTKGSKTVIRRWDLPTIRLDSTNPRHIGVMVGTLSDAPLQGVRAVSFLAEVLPRVNWDGGDETEIRAATREVDAAESALGPSASTGEQEVWERLVEGPRREPMPLNQLTLVRRLALEMAVTEEMERRALAQEASTTEYMAERESEIARIADDMFLPSGVTRALERLIRRRP
jgi:hypothetical protein